MISLHSKSSRTLATSLVAGLLLLWEAQLWAQPALPSVEDFFGLPEVAEEQISPSGQYLAILGRGESGRIRLLTIDLSAPKRILATFSYDNGDIRSAHWVSDKRLVFSVRDSTGERATGAGGLIAMDSDGSDRVRLVDPNGLPSSAYFFFSVTNDGSDDIVVAEPRSSGPGGTRDRQIVLHRVNTRTKRLTNMTVGQPTGVLEWLLDMDGVPRIAVAMHENRRTIYARGEGARAWDRLADFDLFTSNEFTPRFIGPDGALYAGHLAMGSLYRYDIAQRRFDTEPSLRLDGFDLSIDPVLDFEARKLLGFHYLIDARGTVWLNQDLARHQKKIDAALPGTINTIECGHCLSSKYLLIESHSDRQPTQYFAYEVASERLLGVGSSRPHIKPAQMGQRDFIRYVARDGMPIPAYVTTPPAAYSKPYPLVVLVHGGPWVRGASWEWDAQAQFLASRGYAVIQPEFRGSTGFGFDHFKAGWRQWGLAMQDDLADAANWAIAQGLADARRVAIMGASYGGYASLMGLIRNPEIFKCGVEWVGVTDLNLLFSDLWGNMSDIFLQYGAPVLIGDPVADVVRLNAASPLQNAARITQPILMAYGSLDFRVPLAHGEKIRHAISTPESDVEWIVYPWEGHGWYIEKDNVDFWARVEKFLDKHLKSPSPSTKSASIN